MLLHALLLLLPLLATGGDAYHLARQAEQSLENRATYQGGWAVQAQGSCPQDYSTACGDKTQVNQYCCPTTNKCFGYSWVPYCCPGTQDCKDTVNTFPVCADPTANMYSASGAYFCCAQGAMGIIPSSGDPFCQAEDLSVPVSLLATMVSQFGGTSVTPFGGYGTNTPATSSVSGPAGTKATLSQTKPPATASSGSPSTPDNTSSSSPASSSSTPANSAAPSSGSTTSPTSKTDLSVGAIAGIVIGAAFLLILIFMIWKCCTHRNWRPWRPKQGAYGPYPGPPYMPATTAPMYAPAPVYPRPAYDPVSERRTGSAVGPMSPRPASATPLSPSHGSPGPDYKPVDAYGMAPGRGRDENRMVEVHAVPSAGGRMELPGI